MRPGGCLELVQQPSSPVLDRPGDGVVFAVAGELALVDEGDEETPRLGGGEVGGGVLEVPDEGHELFGRVVALGLGVGQGVVEHGLVRGGVALDKRASELVLGGEVVKERALGVGAAGAALLQARQVFRRRSSCEVSARFFASYAGGYAIWLLYGLSIGSLPLLLVDAAGCCADWSRSPSH